jgi:hypothetical protein
MWFENLQQSLALGIVFLLADKDIVAKPGQVTWVDDMWKWKAMTETKLVEMRLPARLTIGSYY